MKTEEILRKNVRDLQEQLQVCYIKNKELNMRLDYYDEASVLFYRDDMKDEIWQDICDRLGKAPKCKCDDWPDELDVIIRINKK